MATKEQLLSAGFTEQEILKEAGFNDQEIKSQILPSIEKTIPQRLWAGTKQNLYDWYKAPSIIKSMGGLLEGGIETGIRAIQPSGPAYPPSEKGQIFEQGIVQPIGKEISAIGQDPFAYVKNIPGRVGSWAIDNPINAAMNIVPFVPKGAQSFVNPISLATKPITALAGSQKVNSIAQRLYDSAIKVSTKLDIPDMHRVARRGLELNIMPTEKGLSNLRNNMNIVGKEINNVIGSGSWKGDTIDMQKVANSIDGIKKTFSNRLFHDPEIDSILDNLKSSMLELHGEKISTEQAQIIKRTTQHQINYITDKVQTIQREAEKIGTAEIRKQLETKYPELKGLNPMQQENIWLEDAIVKAIKAEEKAQMLPGISFFNVLKNKTLDNPKLKAKVGIILNKINKVEPVGGMSTAIPYIATELSPNEDIYTQMAKEFLK